ncbi:formylglycine-generating enzyme family protein [Ottowia thiooxydans]|uniref:formylglycine-generating enzyme family protein n=1 Tax=Ottowia thiooxydans TaxID=219182 RepID=UPI0003FD7362|nr:formylglycine-generating enzyme family protein [Ottowia thiooxydans]
MKEMTYPGMILIDGGEFSKGSARFYEEERPVKRVRVNSFWIDETPVTNKVFARFVDETGYVTLAERIAEGMSVARMPAAGSSVFARPEHPVDLGDPSQWWEFRASACWRHPLGQHSTTAGLEEHPVVHVAYEDATAFASWAGKELPAEAEWEFAARGGLDGEDYAWGNSLAPDGLMLGNYWQGEFPMQNTLADGWERTSPVRSYPGNGYGLFDMIGNVWEWTSDLWTVSNAAQGGKPSCCSTKRPEQESSLVLKGGSHLCAQNYCQRYRPAARHAQPARETTGHIGFRCIVRV